MSLRPAIFKVLASEQRLRILLALGVHGGLSCYGVAKFAWINHTQAKQHLIVLENAGLVVCEQRGSRLSTREYRLNHSNPVIPALLGFFHDLRLSENGMLCNVKETQGGSGYPILSGMQKSEVELQSLKT